MSHTAARLPSLRSTVLLSSVCSIMVKNARVMKTVKPKKVMKKIMSAATKAMKAMTKRQSESEEESEAPPKRVMKAMKLKIKFMKVKGEPESSESDSDSESEESDAPNKVMKQKKPKPQTGTKKKSMAEEIDDFRPGANESGDDSGGRKDADGDTSSDDDSEEGRDRGKKRIFDMNFEELPPHIKDLYNKTKGQSAQTKIIHKLVAKVPRKGGKSFKYELKPQRDMFEDRCGRTRSLTDPSKIPRSFHRPRTTQFTQISLTDPSQIIIPFVSFFNSMLPSQSESPTSTPVVDIKKLISP